MIQQQIQRVAERLSESVKLWDPQFIIALLIGEMGFCAPEQFGECRFVHNEYLRFEKYVSENGLDLNPAVLFDPATLNELRGYDQTLFISKCVYLIRNSNTGL